MNEEGDPEIVILIQPATNKEENFTTACNIDNCEVSFPCPLCCFSCGSKKDLTEHCRKVHLKLVHISDSGRITVAQGTLTKCIVCDFTALRKGRMTSHLVKKHGIIEKIVCKVCNKSFSSHRALQHHTSQFHTYINTPCEICGKVCKNRSSFQRHQLMHSRSFTCEQCEKEFRDRRCYTQHLKIHDPRAMFQCPHCNQTFTQKFNMLNHVKVKHLKEGKFQCDYCEYTSFYKNAVNNHIDRVHKNIKKVRFLCRYCPKAFTRKLNYEEHVDIHEGRYRHVCPYCSKKYRNKSRCKIHSSACGLGTSVSTDSSTSEQIQVYTVLSENVIEEADIGLEPVLV